MLESFFALTLKISSIFGWAFFSFWSAIPAGIAIDVPPLLIIFIVTVSYGSGAAAVVLVGAPLRERIRRRMATRTTEGEIVPNKMVIRVQQAWRAYGLLGLAILAPMTVGSQVGAVIGLSFGARPLQLVLGMTLGAFIWAVGITTLIEVGLLTL